MAGAAREGCVTGAGCLSLRARLCRNTMRVWYLQLARLPPSAPAPDPRVVSRRHARGTAVAGASSTRSGNPATSPPRGPRALAIAFVAAADAFARIFAHPPPAAGTRPPMIVRAASRWTPTRWDRRRRSESPFSRVPPHTWCKQPFEVVVAEGNVQVSRARESSRMARTSSFELKHRKRRRRTALRRGKFSPTRRCILQGG